MVPKRIFELGNNYNEERNYNELTKEEFESFMNRVNIIKMR